jgi:hypothetical protein
VHILQVSLQETPDDGLEGTGENSTEDDAGAEQVVIELVEGDQFSSTEGMGGSTEGDDTEMEDADSGVFNVGV